MGEKLFFVFREKDLAIFIFKNEKDAKIFLKELEENNPGLTWNLFSVNATSIKQEAEDGEANSG